MAFPSIRAPRVEFPLPRDSSEPRVAVKVYDSATLIGAIGNSCERAKIEAATCNGRKALPKRLIPSLRDKLYDAVSKG
jgi:hypothetical protein